ncbi:hypothetical protein FQR65_LT19884 [Abscondita terminalis]|nr:hypothetical protein FQR65_LT19884 [Abscondita terminalis]
MLRHRLPKHLYKCHPEEMRAKREAENKKHMEEWERHQFLRPPIQQKFMQDVTPLNEDEYWDEEEPCQLEHECLYKVKSALYHNKSARQRALEQMASVISGVRPNTTVNDVVTKINSLRIQDNKECAKLRSKPSGCSEDVVSIKGGISFVRSKVVDKGTKLLSKIHIQADI